jgi:hypothetical protein
MQFTVLLRQVAHFEPQTINLYGEGVFPQIYLNLPRLAAVSPEVGDDYNRMLAAAKENLLNADMQRTDNRPASAMSDLDEANSQVNEANSQVNLLA